MAKEKEQVEVPKEKSVKLSPQEQQIINSQRALAKKREQCVQEIEAVLKKYGAKLGVDPNSPLRSPRVVVSL